MTTNVQVSFMDRAEQLLRQEAPKKGLSVWRGQCAGFFYPKEKTFEIIVVGLLEEGKDPSPTLTELAIKSPDGESAFFHTDKRGEFCPLGGGWDPFERLRKYIAELPNLA